MKAKRMYARPFDLSDDNDSPSGSRYFVKIAIESSMFLCLISYDKNVRAIFSSRLSWLPCTFVAYVYSSYEESRVDPKTGTTFSEKSKESLERTVYSSRGADGTTSTERPWTGSADIVKEGLSRSKSQCLSLFLARQPLKGHTFSLPNRQLRSPALSNVDVVVHGIFRRFGYCAPLAFSAYPSPFRYPFAITLYQPPFGFSVRIRFSLSFQPPLFLCRSIYLSVRPSFFLTFLNFHSSSRALHIFYFTVHAAFFRLVQRTSNYFPFSLRFLFSEPRNSNFIRHVARFLDRPDAQGIANEVLPFVRK